jgi:MYXO-CTERM domain-containing protein
VLQTIAPTTPATVAGPPVTFGAFIDGGCDAAALSWSSSDGQSGTGAQFNWTPPSTQCTPTTVSITATATWGRGAPVTSTSVESVMLTPWGRAETPNFTTPVTQLGGTTRIWSPTDSQHACAATMTFPGTELIWDPIAPSQSLVTPLDGGLLVVASECFSEQLIATARRRVVGQSILSDAGTITVDVQANVPPLGASAAFTLVADAGPGLVTGELGLTASCLPQRTTSAVVSVFDGTTLVNSDTFDASGPFTLTVPGGCAGGTRLVVAKLFEDGGFTGAQTQQSVELLDVPVAVGAQSVSQIVASCGEGVHTRVSLAPVDGTCMATETSWKIISGAPVVTISGTGTTFDLQTSSLDFSSAGTQFVVEWGVDAGGSKQVTERRTIDVGVEPFIEVSAHSTPALRREEAALEFDVSLRNTTSCAVDGLSVRIPLSGATPVLESVLVDGVKTSARLDASILVLDGVSVPGDGVVHVRLAARPRMLGTPAAAPVASLNGLIVSMDAPTSTPTGCGCTAAPASAWLIVAGLLVLTRRRRRAE